MQRSLTMEDRQGSHQQQQGRPLERWEVDDDVEGGEGMLTSSVMKDWIRSLPDRNFDPDAVPDQAMANFLGGTVSIPANRPGQQVHCVGVLAVSFVTAVSASQSLLFQHPSQNCPVEVCTHIQSASAVSTVVTQINAVSACQPSLSHRGVHGR